MKFSFISILLILSFCNDGLCQSPESSGEKFNARGIFENDFIVSRGKEIISDYDGNLMLNYSSSLEYPDELAGEFSVLYNSNVAHKIFRNENLQVYDPPMTSGYHINAPEWILGYKGIALQTLNFETNFYKPNPQDELVGCEVPLPIPGYHYTNRLQQASEIHPHDVIQILRADGSIIELENTVENSYTGIYVERGINNYGYAVVSFVNEPTSVERKMYYKSIYN